MFSFITDEKSLFSEFCETILVAEVEGPFTASSNTRITAPVAIFLSFFFLK